MSTRLTAMMSLILAMLLAACAQSTAVEPATEAPEAAAAEPNQQSETEEFSGSEVETLFTLNPELTEARFIIGEILANQPNTVIGANKRIQGGGVLNTAEPSQSTLSDFVIDASGFVTDSTNRNRAINQFILQSSQYPFISFQPIGIVGIPGEIQVGEPVSFEVSGLLTIREITQEVTFSGEATMVAEDRVEGMASATVFRNDFDLSIPSVPRVAGVDDEFILEIEFVAEAR